LFKLMGAEPEIARVLMTTAEVYACQGRPRRAVGSLREALSLLNRDSERELYFLALHNLAFYLTSLGRYGIAARLLEETAGLRARHASSLHLLRFDWLKGRIAEGLGEPRAAEESFVRARDGFSRNDLELDAALVTLDLALLWSRQRRFDEVEIAVRQLLPALDAQQMEREAQVARSLASRAASQIS